MGLPRGHAQSSLRRTGCILGVVLAAVAFCIGKAPGAESPSEPAWAAPRVPPTPVAEAVFVESLPVIDGRIDDSVLGLAPAITNFTQVIPQVGSPPSEETAVWILYTRKALYLGIRCYDREPDRIIAKQLRRDTEFDSDDHLQVAIDTFRREQDGYFFAVNPAGAWSDGIFGRTSHLNLDWDGIWRRRAHVDEKGWTAEIVIPFSTISFKRDATWGLNLERVIRRRQETVRWTAITLSKDVLSLDSFGDLRGLQDQHQGIGLTFKPYARGSYRDDVTTDHTDGELKAGFDLTYRIAPSLTALMTIYPDFAETEIDDRIINLTRFPLFLPEKRDFFLQDATLFSFGGLPESKTPYYSRRIGLGTDGQPVDIIGGGRLTGRIGGTSVAMLAVHQAEQDGVPAKNLGVMRASQQILKESSVGFIGTYGDPTLDGDAALGGVDFNYLNSRLPGGRSLVGNTFFMATTSDRYDGNDAAFGGDLDFPNEPLDFHLFFRQWGSKFDPALGFLRRNGVREYIGSVRYVWRPNKKLIRRISLGSKVEFTSDLDNMIVEEEHHLPYLTFETPANDDLILTHSHYRDVLEEPFEIQPGIVIPAGDYRWSQFRPRLRTSEARPISAGLSYRGGGFYTGTRHEYGVNLDWRPVRYFSIGGEYDLNDINLEEGSFDVHVLAGKTTIALSANLTWTTIVQYDNLSDLVGFNTRLRWTFRPGNDVFVVWNQSSLFDDWRLARQQREGVLKVALAFSF